MAKRTYQPDHGFLMGLAAREAGLNRNGCAAYSLARALAAPDEHREAAEWLPHRQEESLRSERPLPGATSVGSRVGLDTANVSLYTVCVDSNRP